MIEPRTATLDDERALLGCCLIDSAAAASIAPELRPEDFSAPHHRLAAQAILRVLAAGAEIETASVVASLEMPRADAVKLVVGLGDAVASAANIRHFLERVREAATRRRLAKAGQLVIEASKGAETSAEALQQAEAALVEARLAGGAQRAATPIMEVVGTVYASIEQRSERRGAISGLSTGLADLDRLTAGLHPGNLVIVAGRPAQGKSACAMGMAVHAAKLGAPTLVFSLEMSKEELVQRALCAEGRLDAHRIRVGLLYDYDWPSLSKASAVISELPMWLDDTGAISLAEVRQKCRTTQAHHGLGLVVIDYIQLMKGTTAAKSREQEVGETSRGLKALAKELGVPIVALSQLNRALESRPDKRPHLGDLRDSGSIEQDADLVAFIYRDETYHPDSADKGIAEIIIGKQRAGATGTVRVRFWGEFTKFADLEAHDGDGGWQRDE